MQEGVKAKLSKIKKLETGERKTTKDRPQHFLMAPRYQVRDLTWWRRSQNFWSQHTRVLYLRQKSLQDAWFDLVQLFLLILELSSVCHRTRDHQRPTGFCSKAAKTFPHIQQGDQVSLSKSTFVRG